MPVRHRGAHVCTPYVQAVKSAENAAASTFPLLAEPSNLSLAQLLDKGHPTPKTQPEPPLADR